MLNSLCHRITPACAGTTCRCSIQRLRYRDHPRVCGDYARKSRTGPGIRGSPPRVRGLLQGNCYILLQRRITPACAGTTNIVFGNLEDSRDHPRVCGDYAHSTPLDGVVTGSPPRVRGLPARSVISSPDWGITPACAGTTKKVKFVRYMDKDHPRVCGDYYRYAQVRNPRFGSPPRVRGLLRGQLIPLGLVGITPACAGTTSTGIYPRRRSWDHPRVCGDYRNLGSKLGGLTGSPPRVRGLHVFPRVIRGVWGITPACAGTTRAPGTG